MQRFNHLSVTFSHESTRSEPGPAPQEAVQWTLLANFLMLQKIKNSRWEGGEVVCIVPIRVCIGRKGDA